MKENRIDVQVLKRRAEWVLYSSCTTEQIAAAQAYFKLYENAIERWHTKAFIKVMSTAVFIALMLSTVFLCLMVKILL